MATRLESTDRHPKESTLQIFLATGNAGKQRDFAGMESSLRLALLPDIGSLPVAVENGANFEENARIKAEHYSRYVTALVVADDSGLEVDALGGAPGVHSARFAGGHGDDEANNRLLLQRMKDVPLEQRTARFVCVLAVARRGTTLATFRATAEGYILEAPVGSFGFGYDPLFYSPEAGCGFGELPAERKAQFSHRGKAARAVWEWVSGAGGLEAPE